MQLCKHGNQRAARNRSSKRAQQLQYLLFRLCQGLVGGKQFFKGGF